MLGLASSLADLPVALNGLGLAAAGLAAMSTPALNVFELLIHAHASPFAKSVCTASACMFMALASLAWCAYVLKLLVHPNIVLREALDPMSGSALGTIFLTTISICSILPASFALLGVIGMHLPSVNGHCLFSSLNYLFVPVLHPSSHLSVTPRPPSITRFAASTTCSSLRCMDSRPWVLYSLSRPVLASWPSY